MSDLRELYQEMILDHNKNPRNFREIEHHTCCAEGHNPLCGDQLTLYLDVEDGIVKDVGFKGSGCAISTASASMMTEAIKGQPVEKIEAVFKRFHDLVTEGVSPEPDELGKLAVFSGVCEFPVRVKCATLPWHTMQAALAGDAKTTTE